MYGIILLGITVILKKLKVPKISSSIISIVILVFFMVLTGFTPSCVRACIMAIMVKIAGLIHRKSTILNSLCFVLLLTLIYNPYNITHISVLLSYGGVIRNTSLFSDG